MAISFGNASQSLVIDMTSSDLKIAVGYYNRKTQVVMLEKAGIVPLESDAITDGHHRQLRCSHGIKACYGKT